MRPTLLVFRRELAAYFATPLAFVFLIIFLITMGAFTFYVGHFYENGIADLSSFFGYHPWLYLLLMPALAMRLWAEERRGGTLELLLTLPVTVWDAVLGKFLAAWAFAGIALILTFPIWVTVNYLGDPDNGVILAAYVGSFLMAGAYLAIGSAIARATSRGSTRSRRRSRRRPGSTRESFGRGRAGSSTIRRMRPAPRSSARSIRRRCAPSTASAISSARRGDDSTAHG